MKSNGGWKVTGQKVWTTYAHEAKWCMLLARTDQDAPKHKGITYFILDMDQDEVEVRPLRQITGEAEFNEIFMEEAEIPDENVIGEVGGGWQVAITTLMFERAGLGAAAVIGLRRDLEDLIELINERGLGEDPVIRQQVAELQDRHRGDAARRAARADRDDEDRHPRPRGLAREVAVGQDNQELTELATDVARRRGAHPDSEWTYRFLRSRANSIEGGTTEVLKNIIAERVLGLPRLEVTSMDFDLNDEQREIKETAASSSPPLQAREGPRAGRGARLRRRPLEGDRRARLARDRDRRGDGGQGLGMVELVILCEELGYACAPARSSPTRSARPGASRRRLATSSGRVAARDRLRRGARRLRRSSPAATALVPTPRAPRCWSSTTATGRLLVEPGRRRDRAARADRRDPLLRTRLGLRRRAAARATSRPAATGRWSRSPPSSTGVGQRAMEMAVEYAREREQFGRPIGAYQAVSHRCAGMLYDVEESRSLTYYAAWAADAEPESLPLAARDGQGARLRRRLGGAQRPRSRSSAASASPGSTTSSSGSSALAVDRPAARRRRASTASACADARRRSAQAEPAARPSRRAATSTSGGDLGLAGRGGSGRPPSRSRRSCRTGRGTSPASARR